LFYYVVFAALIVFCAIGALTESIGPKAPYRPGTNLVVFVAAVALIAIAGTRAHSVDRDYMNYEAAFNCFRLGYDHCRMEPVFNVVSSAANALRLGVEGVIFFYAAAAIALYALLIVRSETPYLSLLTYFSTMFFLHEMTQIRVGLAIAIALWGLQYLYRQERIKFMAFCLAASVVHLSCAAFFILLFMPTRRHYAWLGMLLLSAAVASSFGNYLKPLYDAVFGYLIGEGSAYIYYAREAEEINRFGLVRTATIGAYIVAAWNADRIATRVPQIYIYLNSLLVALCTFYVFFYLPAVPIRMLEVFGSVLMFLLPATMFAFRSPITRIACAGGVVAFTVLHFIFYIEIEEIVQSYRSVVF
jgi:hypothetical protein